MADQIIMNSQDDDILVAALDRFESISDAELVAIADAAEMRYNIDELVRELELEDDVTDQGNPPIYGANTEFQGEQLDLSQFLEEVDVPEMNISQFMALVQQGDITGEELDLHQVQNLFDQSVVERDEMDLFQYMDLNEDGDAAEEEDTNEPLYQNVVELIDAIISEVKKYENSC